MSHSWSKQISLLVLMKPWHLCRNIVLLLCKSLNTALNCNERIMRFMNISILGQLVRPLHIKGLAKLLVF